MKLYLSTIRRMYGHNADKSFIYDCRTHIEKGQNYEGDLCFRLTPDLRSGAPKTRTHLDAIFVDENTSLRVK